MVQEVFATISQGTLKGKKVTSKATGEDYYSFQGIPYARPPTGPLRFKPPQPPVPWEGVRDATKEGSICFQYYHYQQIYKGDEDCLFLNVYTKEWPPKNPKPVMVWFHGGGFFRGSGDTDIHGPDYLVKEDVILVTFNYRVSVLGFLHVEGSDVTPNNGLRDQVSALKWINENISCFGGDPNNVTIFGYSAGGSAIHYMMLAPSSKGLFHRGIAQSGTTLHEVYNIKQEEATARAFRLGKSLGISTSDPQKLVDSFRKLSAKDLVMAHDKALTDDEKMHPITIAFTVSEEKESVDSCIPGHPEKLIKAGRFHRIPLISGVTSAEGKIGLSMSINNPSLEEVDNNFERALTWNLKLRLGKERFSQAAHKIREFYFGKSPVSTDTVQKYVDLQSDLQFNYSAYVVIENYLKHSDSPIYTYCFTKKEPFPIPGANPEVFKLPGANHGSDVAHLFHMDINPFKFKAGSDDEKASRNIIKLWTNFAKNGNPTNGMNIEWPTMKIDYSPYLDIGEELHIKENLYQERMKFLDKVFK